MNKITQNIKNSKQMTKTMEIKNIKSFLLEIINPANITIIERTIVEKKKAPFVIRSFFIILASIHPYFAYKLYVTFIYVNIYKKPSTPTLHKFNSSADKRM